MTGKMGECPENLTSHLYNEDVAISILSYIIAIYHPLFKELQTFLIAKANVPFGSRAKGNYQIG
jgi:hypothetical protein